MNPNGIRGAPPLLGPWRVLPGRLSVSYNINIKILKYVLTMYIR